ncbi:Phospholipid/cholesterol/gamma-HCH transport system substrate-binding protein OS=Sphingobium scionense OX=1404341 GN=GGQ90_003361 PE=4 SV=1 [Sphingobium scionense]
MERHAHYALVGVISTIVFIAAAAFVIWLGSLQINRKVDDYRILFRGPVRGLSEGGEVQFNGIKVGQIERIDLDPRDPNRVITDIQIKAGTPVRDDLVATLESEGISGVSIVQISAGTPSRPLLNKVSKEERPVIRSKGNALSSLLQGGGQLIQKAADALDRVNRVLSDRTIANAEKTFQNVRETSDALVENRAMFDRASSALAKLDLAATDIQDAARSVRTIANGDGRQAFSDISDAAAELKLGIRDARGVIAKLDTQSSAIGTTTLPNINATMLELQETAKSLDGLIRDVRRDPRATLTKGSGKELELPR